MPRNYEGIMFTAACHSPYMVVNFETFKESHGCFQIKASSIYFHVYNHTFAYAVIKFPVPYVASVHNIQRLQIFGSSEDLNHPHFVNKPDKQSCLLCLERTTQDMLFGKWKTYT